MFIAMKARNRTKLRRSEIFDLQAPAERVANISLLRSWQPHLDRAFYKYFVPPGLLALVAAIVVCGVSIINSHASESAPNVIESSAPQEQMQFPEGLDYSRFQHNSRNHSRLPCLLCHRRDANAPIPKRPGGSN